MPSRTINGILVFVAWMILPVSLNIHFSLKLTGTYKLKWHILHKHECISPFKCKNLKIQMCLWFVNWHLQAFNELSMRRIWEINICFEMTFKVFVPTLVLSEDAEVIDLFFWGYSYRISFAVNWQSLKLFLFRRNFQANPINILAPFIRLT